MALELSAMEPESWGPLQGSEEIGSLLASSSRQPKYREEDFTASFGGCTKLAVEKDAEGGQVASSRRVSTRVSFTSSLDICLEN